MSTSCGAFSPTIRIRRGVSTTLYVVQLELYVYLYERLTILRAL
jgi:hypothetical protein